MTEEEGHTIGARVAMELSGIILTLPSNEAGDGFMRAIKEWHDFIEEGIEADWMKEILQG